MTFFRRFYTVDSHQKTSGSHHNFMFSIDMPTSTNLEIKQLHVALTSASIPKSYYLVPAGRNTFTLTENGTPITVTVPAGNYNVNTFRTTVATLLNAATVNANVYSITFSDSTAKYTFSVGGAGVPASITVPDANGSGIHDQFGLDKKTTVAFPFTSTNCVSFSTIAAVQVRSDIVGGGGILQNVFAAESPAFSTIAYYANDIDIRAHPLATKDSNSFNFRLTDPDGNLIDTNGRPITLTLMIYTPVEMAIRDYIFLKTMMIKMDIENRRTASAVAEKEAAIKEGRKALMRTARKQLKINPPVTATSLPAIQENAQENAGNPATEQASEKAPQK